MVTRSFQMRSRAKPMSMIPMMTPSMMARIFTGTGHTTTIIQTGTRHTKTIILTGIGHTTTIILTGIWHTTTIILTGTGHTNYNNHTDGHRAYSEVDWAAGTPGKCPVGRSAL